MDMIKAVVKRPITIFVLIVIIILGGTISYVMLPLESFPEVKFPLLIVNTFYFGVAPGDIETLVTNPLERELKTLDGLKKITSFSMEGLSSIKVEFMPNVNLDVARQKVKDKVDIAKPKLPADAEEPIIKEINFSEMPIMYISLSGKKIGLYNLKKIADNLKDKIKLIKGVLDVDISGGLEREIQVNVDPYKLKYYKVSLNDIINKIRQENITLPGGNINMGSYDYSIRIPGEIKKPEDMFNWIIKEKELRPVYIKDVANIVYKYKEIKSKARLNGVEAVTLDVKKRTGSNIVLIAKAVKQLLKTEKKETFPKLLDYRILNDQSKNIENMVQDLENNIITSLILVVLVLFFAMGLRNALFVGIAIPLSMLISFSVLSMLGITLNMMVLFSLILALGMLVDNAIVLVENIYRHRQLGEDLITSAIIGAKEIAIPITTSTLTTLCAFMPLIFWPGIIGDFMSYLPKTVMIVLTASLLVALFINPVICSLFLKLHHTKKLKQKVNKNSKFIKVYRTILYIAVNNRWKTMFLTIILFIATIFLYGKYGKPIIFFPKVDPKFIIAEIELPTNTKIELTDKVTRRIENIVKNTKDIRSYVTNVGTEGREETNKSKITIDLQDLLDRKQNSVKTLNEVRAAVPSIAGATIKISKNKEVPPVGAAFTV